MCRPTETIDAARRIAPANLTLTAIRETAVVLAERSTARAATTLETTPVDTTDAPIATETVPAVATETPEPAPTVVLPTATNEAATRIAPANLTLTVIRETVAAMAERSTARAAATMEAPPVDTAEAPLATETVPTVATKEPELAPTVVLPTATLEDVGYTISRQPI